MAGSAIGIELDADQLVLTRGRDFKWSFENLDTNNQPIDFPAGILRFELDTGGQHNALQQIDVDAASDGTYTLSLDGHETDPIDYYDITEELFTIAGEVEHAIAALPNVGVGNVTVHPGALIPSWRIAMTLNDSVNEVQEITFIGDVPTGGTFRLGYGTQATTQIAYGATPAEVQAALEAVSAIGTDNVEVTALQDGGYRVEFVGTKAATNVQQITPYTSGVDADHPLISWFFGLFGLGGAATKANTVIKTTTVVSGQAKLSEPLVQTLESTINAVFNAYAALGGVAMDFIVKDAHNAVVKVASLKTFTEADLITFGVDITADTIEGAINNSTALAGVIGTFVVDFFWNYSFQVEFVGDLSDTFEPAIVPDYSELTGANDEEAVSVTVLKPGKERFTKWAFDIDGSLASLKVESEDADKILPRTLWQLVFLADGEAEGGDPITLGKVKVQGA